MVDGADNVYITDYSNRVREVTASGTIVTVAGNGGNEVMRAMAARPSTQISAHRRECAMDGSGNIYVADTYNDAIRVLTPEATSPVLTITSAHSGSFSAGGSGTYTLTVGNAANAGSTSGTVTVTAISAAGLTLNSMSASGWFCTNATCTRTDPLGGGAVYPSIMMSVATLATAPFEVTNQVTVSGGGSNAAGASDTTIVVQPAASIVTLNPATLVVGGPTTTIVLTGNGVSADSIISWTFNGMTTGFPALIQGSRITATVPPQLLTAVGPVQIALTNGGGVSSNSLSLTIAGGTPQTISFGALPDVAVGAPAFTVSATASSGLPVTFTSSTLAVCTVSGTTVTIVTAGGCSITAVQPGDATYAAASLTQSFTVTFVDVGSSDYYNAAITAMAQKGITAGCGSNGYCPQADVTRDEMAIFMVRAVYGSDNFTYSSTPYFTDVTPTTFGFKWIQKLKELGITAGCGATTYCPTQTVTRDQMAIFIERIRLGVSVAGSSSTFTYPTTPLFSDINGDFAFAWIQRLKQDNITSGCTATTYCPGTPVIRGDMAIFVMRGAFNQFLPAGTPLIASISPSTLALGTSGTYTITGTNTHFVQGTTVLSPIPGVTIGAITVTSATTMTVQLTAASNAVTQPYSILAITGTEEDVLPNGLVIQ